MDRARQSPRRTRAKRDLLGRGGGGLRGGGYDRVAGHSTDTRTVSASERNAAASGVGGSRSGMISPTLCDASGSTSGIVVSPSASPTTPSIASGSTLE